MTATTRGAEGGGAGGPLKVMAVVGARPNMMKAAPLMQELSRYPDVETVLVHTGQHYDERMSEAFFRDLGLPAPDHYLGVGSGTHAAQTAHVMLALEPIMTAERPEVLVVVGDVNSTLAAALVAAKLGIRIAHVEAGLRSYDRGMPEEINRVLTDAISDLLFTTERDAEENLRREGVPPERIHFVGNVMIDTLLRELARARALGMPARMGVRPRGYAVLTLHRPSNVDDPVVLEQLLEAVAAVQSRVPVLFPVHPRTRQRLAQGSLGERLAAMPGLRLLEPLGYLEFLGLLADARLVLTDSGGIQEETTILDVPCLTLRENTERPVTVTEGTNEVVGTNADRITAAALRILDGGGKAGARPELWDGRAAERIVAVLRSVGKAGS
ncbi:MAG TPA: UDP-N-acetylglucosamine 2-epimerase (non-hydrolyzing) [Longimicrobiales bacterium]|nr:UDP-N-acetylglucosamine 2-epimerase (non-hydrolyzing) [Longimicrobiales bacterium]